jgi:hypothetical protein
LYIIVSISKSKKITAKMFPKLASVILTFLAASSAAGFAIPHEVEDGVYLLSMDENNNQNHTRLPDVDGFITARRGGERSGGDLLSRGSPYSTCIGLSIPKLDWATADAQFQSACASSGSTLYKNQQALLAVSGDAVAYMCNYSPKGSECQPFEYSAATASLQSTCTTAGDGGVQGGKSPRTGGL